MRLAHFKNDRYEQVCLYGDRKTIIGLYWYKWAIHIGINVPPAGAYQYKIGKRI